MNRKRIDWNLIKSEYVEGIRDEEGKLWEPTLQELALRHNCSISALKKKSMKEKWQEQRKNYQRKVEELRREKKSEIMARESAEFDSKIFEYAKMGIEDAGRRLESSKRALPSGELLKLSKALRNFQVIGRTALGESIGEEKQKIEIEIVFSDNLEELKNVENS